VVFVFLSMTYFTTIWSLVLSIFLKWHNFILLYGWIVLHWIYIPILNKKCNTLSIIIPDFKLYKNSMVLTQKQTCRLME
jgi:hypothetical protein